MDNYYNFTNSRRHLWLGRFDQGFTSVLKAVLLTPRSTLTPSPLSPSPTCCLSGRAGIITTIWGTCCSKHAHKLCTFRSKYSMSLKSQFLFFFHITLHSLEHDTLLSLVNGAIFDGLICVKLSRAQLLTRWSYFKLLYHLPKMLCMTVCQTSLKKNWNCDACCAWCGQWIAT